MTDDKRVARLANEFDIAELQMLSLGMIHAKEAWRDHPVCVRLKEDVDAALTLAVEENIPEGHV